MVQGKKAAKKPSPKQGRGDGRLLCSEENVLRMRYGLPVSDDHELGTKAEGHPQALAKLRAMEERAFQLSGRIKALRAEAQVATESDATERQRKKIIEALKGKAKTGQKPGNVITVGARTKRSQTKRIDAKKKI